MKKLGIFLAGVALLVSSIVSAKADYIRDHITGVYVYNARKDMTPIEVNLYNRSLTSPKSYKPVAPIEEAEKKSEFVIPILSTIIPRALITGCTPYASKFRSEKREFEKIFKVDILPERVTCNQLFLDYYYPTGVPYTGRMPKFIDLPQPDVGLGYVLSHKRDTESIRVAIHRSLGMGIVVKIRPKHARDNKLWNFKDDLVRINPYNGKPNTIKIGQYEGFTVTKFNTDSRWRYYYDNGPDEIRYVACVMPVEMSYHKLKCTTHMPINDNFYVKLTFLDFRLNGGRAFLRQRVRNFKKHFCGYLKCDEKALQAAKITGEIK